MRQAVLSIRNVLLCQGVLGLLIAAGLAGFGLLGTRLQSAALDRTLVLEQALHNHNSADVVMDKIRADVFRAIQRSTGTNTEGEAVIRTDLRYHIETAKGAIAKNLALPLSPGLHASYGRIDTLVTVFAGAARAAVELALSDPVTGAKNVESFRQNFSVLEEMMDGVRDVLRIGVREVREDGALTAKRARDVIAASASAGMLLLVLITMAAVGVARGITSDLAASRAQAHHLALHDALTGLPNRALLAERLAQALAHARRHGGALAMLCLDLDRFKQVNDTLGHAVGDALLRAVADRLRANTRDCDTVARLGGDEFAVIHAPVERVEDTGSLARRLVSVLSEPYDLGGHRVVVGASAGIALAPADTGDGDELLKMADMALYRAKADGRGTFRSFEPGMDAKLQARRVLELDLREAVAAGEFQLHYQPLVELASGETTAFEALVRWRHPRRGLVPPDEFIPLAEETGLIVPLGAWVLRRACADAAGWPDAVRVAVNLSAVQFEGADLVAVVTDALAVSGLAPERLELEITETALLADAEATLAILRRIRAHGVRIAMDDFGTGYSSLGYLRSFPFDKIKIDRCFVRDIETSADCEAIVRAVIGLGATLGIATTAEGVETRAQFDRLRAEGCDQVQGYFISRPIPVEGVAALLGSQWAAAEGGAARTGAAFCPERAMALLPGG